MSCDSGYVLYYTRLVVRVGKIVVARGCMVARDQLLGAGC